MTWIKIENRTPNKPEVLLIAQLTELHPHHAFGKLVVLWIWADENTVDGNASGVTKETIDVVVGHKGFGQAMETAGWLTAEGGTATLPNFDLHNGQTSKRRALTARRVARHKSKQGRDPPSVTLALPRSEIRSDTDTDRLSGIFQRASEQTLRDPRRLLEWHDWAVSTGDPSVEDSRNSRLRVIALAERALAKGAKPAALFATLVGGQKWQQACGKYQRLAEEKFAAFEASRMNVAAKIG